MKDSENKVRMIRKTKQQIIIGEKKKSSTKKYGKKEQQTCLEKREKAHKPP